MNDIEEELTGSEGEVRIRRTDSYWTIASTPAFHHRSPTKSSARRRIGDSLCCCIRMSSTETKDSVVLNHSWLQSIRVETEDNHPTNISVFLYALHWPIESTIVIYRRAMTMACCFRCDIISWTSLKREKQNFHVENTLTQRVFISKLIETLDERVCQAGEKLFFSVKNLSLSLCSFRSFIPVQWKRSFS